MKRETIQINESKLRRIIESAINEIGDTEAGQTALGALHAKKVYDKVRDDYKKSGLIKGHITTDDEKRVLDYAVDKQGKSKNPTAMKKAYDAGYKNQSDKENARGLGESKLKNAIRESINSILKEYDEDEDSYYGGGLPEGQPRARVYSEEENILKAYNAMVPYIEQIADICNNSTCTMSGIDDKMFQILNSFDEIPRLAKYYQTTELDEQFDGGYGYNSSREIWTAEDVEDCFTNDEIMDIIEKILGVSDVNSISDYDAYLGIIADKLTEKNLSYNAIMELINNE